MNGFNDGIVGFFLFFAHWLSPQTGKAAIEIDFSKNLSPDAIICKCKLDIAWNKQLEQLIDAGIPLCYKIYHFSDKSDTVSFYRSLHFNMVDYSYNYTDSTEKARKKSKSYSLVDLALRDFCRWEIEIPKNASVCKVEVVILPSKAEQLNRIVDMSRVWGQQKVFTVFNPKKPISKKKSVSTEE
jgi:hypothetical protein